MRPIRVLLVDDEEPILRVLGTWCRKWGFDVTAVESADAAIAVMAANPADIVLTDIIMPIHDGIWLLEQIRAKWPNTLVIMESGAQEEATVRRSQQCGAADYLPKPFGREMVYQALQRAAARIPAEI